MAKYARRPYLVERREPKRNNPQTTAMCRFDANDLADIADCFERYTGHAAWVGYGFANAKHTDLGTIYLFSSDAQGGRLILRQPSEGCYELLGFDGEILWSGSHLMEFAKALIPDNKD